VINVNQSLVLSVMSKMIYEMTISNRPRSQDPLVHRSLKNLECHTNKMMIPLYSCTVDFYSSAFFDRQSSFKL